VFALATWTLAAATLLLAGGLARALARRWLSSEQAPLWIDRQTALEGRLATALELEDRDARRAPFFPLLVDDNARRIAAWRRVREERWGEDRERVHEAWERAERGAGPGRVSPPADRLADEREQEERWAVVRRPPPGARPARGEGGAAPTGDTPRGEGAAGRGA